MAASKPLERHLAGERAALLQPRSRLVQQLEAVHQRLAEARLLLLQRRFDQRLRTNQLRVSRSHFRDERRDEAIHQRLFRAEQMRVAHRPAHDPAEDVSPALVRRQNAVRDEES
jgi:hypothetical protein